MYIYLTAFYQSEEAVQSVNRGDDVPCNSRAFVSFCTHCVRLHVGSTDVGMQDTSSEWVDKIPKKRKQVTTESILENFLLLGTSLDDTVREETVLRAFGGGSNNDNDNDKKRKLKAKESEELQLYVFVWISLFLHCSLYS